MDSAIANWHATFAIEVAMSVNIRVCVELSLAKVIYRRVKKKLPYKK